MGTGKNSCKTAAVMSLLGKGPAVEQDVQILSEQPRDIEVITAEVLDAKLKIGENLFIIGQGMIEAKAQLSHGEWLSWLTNRVEFSEDTAQNYMKLVRKYSNAEALRYLGYTKALMLLSLPDETRDEYIESTHIVNGEEKTVADMSTRELKAALKARDEALKAAEQAKAEQATAEQAREKLSQDMALANERIAGLNAEVAEHSAKAKEAQDTAARLEKELAELRAKPVEVAVEADPAALEQARQEVEKAMQDKVDRATAARDAALQKRHDLEEALQAAKEKARKEALEISNALQRAKLEREEALIELKKLREQADKAEKKAALTANEDLVLFRTLFDQVQEQVNKLGGVLMKFRNKDPEKAQGLSQAMVALSEKIKGVAQG